MPTIESFGPEGDQGTQVTWTAYDAEPVPVHALEALSLNELDLRFRQELAEQTRADRRPRRPAVVGQPGPGDGRRAPSARRAGGCPRACRQRALRVHVHGLGRQPGHRARAQLASPALTSATDERRRVLLTSLLASADRAVATAATVGALSIAGMRPGRQDA